MVVLWVGSSRLLKRMTSLTELRNSAGLLESTAGDLEQWAAALREAAGGGGAA